MNNFQHATKSEVLDDAALNANSATGVASPEGDELNDSALEEGIRENINATEPPASQTFSFDGHRFDSASLDQYDFDADDFDIDALDGTGESVAQTQSNTNLEDADLEEIEVDFVGDEEAVNVSADHESGDEAFDTVGEVMEVEVIDAEEQDRSYEVYQEGSLTYFRYYLDDEEDGGFYAQDGPVSPRPFLSAGAMGVGVLAATFGVGLLVAEGTNRRAQEAGKGTIADANTQQQPIGSKRVKTEVQGDPAAPDSLKPTWSAADKAIGQSVTAKSSQGGLLAATAETKAEDKVSLAATKMAGGGTAIAAASSASPASASTWNSSAAATPYIPPALAVTPIVTPNYEVVSASSLPSVPLPKLSAVPSQPNPAVLQEQRRLAERMEALRKANTPNYSTAQEALQASATLNTNASDAVWRPDADGRTYVTDPIRSDSAALVTPAEGAYSSSTALNNTQVTPLPDSGSEPAGLETAAQGNEPVAAAPGEPNLLQAPPTGVSEEALQRAALQKQLLNQAIAQPVTGLLVVPVSDAPGMPNLTAPQSATPSDLSSGATLEPDVELTPVPANADDADPLLEAALPVNGLSTEGLDAEAMEALPTAQEMSTLTAAESDMQFNTALELDISEGLALDIPVEAAEVSAETTSNDGNNIVDSLQELLTLAQSPQQILQPLTLAAAQEVVQSSTEIEQFRVLMLNSADYNQLWRMTARSSDRLLAPVHGFVDYQRNVIALINGSNDSTGQAAVEREGVLRLAQALTPAAGELGQQ